MKNILKNLLLKKIMRIFFFIIVLILFSKCKHKIDVPIHTNEIKISEEKRGITSNNKITSFVSKNSTKYSKSKKVIPNHIYQYLDSIEGEKFRIGDYLDSNIELTDDVSDINSFKKELHHLYYDKYSCLLVYSVGGFGRYCVVDFFHEDEKILQHQRFTTVKPLVYTDTLNVFLKTLIIIEDK